MKENNIPSEEISKLKSNIEKLKDIVNKANTAKKNKKNLLEEAKENKIIPKEELKQLSLDIENFDKIKIDKTLIKKAKAKLMKLELEMSLSEYSSLQEEYTQTVSEIENQLKE